MTAIWRHAGFVRMPLKVGRGTLPDTSGLGDDVLRKAIAVSVVFDVMGRALEDCSTPVCLSDGGDAPEPPLYQPSSTVPRSVGGYEGKNFIPVFFSAATKPSEQRRLP